MLFAIHILPAFRNHQSIDALRAKYDPLFNLIPPHITLVFPFESAMTVDAITEHIRKSVGRMEPFRIVMAGISGADEEYLFLNVKVGNDLLIDLHNKLYTGVLRKHLNRWFTYYPHLTIGRINDKQVFQSALEDTAEFSETFETVVLEIVLERIDDTGRSIIERTIPLCPSYG
ncbi:2'-5' RNA ligase family protein [Alicyclobacillus fastidiosus]|uniref:2'-5' RNA ligase family protein n=1 Tax=Alicyclobacillus fastidiosus TaxID=392011 RepID=A0ABY6ZB00_9BACL|nr:2'-5' RNA ligase family protein [Alicyclobacillus fastidiosus]WAH39943.1 2'-5' RNA ligase family protein [Alicyclobacillus fastidiosus]GMA61224.1 2'-5' RNA ligase [Alicyclobacillus fastidiosus]